MKSAFAYLTDSADYRRIKTEQKRRFLRERCAQIAFEQGRSAALAGLPAESRAVRAPRNVAEWLRGYAEGERLKEEQAERKRLADLTPERRAAVLAHLAAWRAACG
jgi:TfoX/Sxy family transcriptional regulator of competence genes